MPANPSLIERLEAAEGGSRELDGLIWVMVEGCGGEIMKWAVNAPDGEWRSFGGPAGYAKVLRKTRNSSPAYTASLDAALALAERVLPGWLWAVTNLHPEYSTGFHAEISAEGEWDCTPTAHAATPALALCIAILRALADGREG